MSIYIDANLLVRFYLEYDGGRELSGLLQSADVKRAWPLPVTDLLRVEVKNGIQRMVFESRDGSAFRTSPEAAAAAQANFEEDYTAGLFLKRVSLTLPDIEPTLDTLVGRHTAKHGFRTYDIMHVASALHLGCTQFFSFDNKAKDIARL